MNMHYFKQLSTGICLCFFFQACSIVEQETGEGSIEVFNKTNAWVDVNINTTLYSLDVNESVIETYELTYEVEHRLFGDDRIKSEEIISVDVNGEGLHAFPFNGTYDVEFDVITETYIEPDAGSLHLTNNLDIIGFSYDVIEIYISPSSSSDWGENLLDEDLHINETAVWRVDPDSWDIKIVYEIIQGFVYGEVEIYNTQIGIDEAESYSFQILGKSTRALKKTTKKSKLTPALYDKNSRVEFIRIDKKNDQ